MDSGATDALTQPQQQQQQQKKPKPGGIKGMWEWYKERPCERKSFLFFAIAFCLFIVFVALFFVDSGSGLTAAGVVAILISGYGSWHFKILLALKEQVEEYARLNKQFQVENLAIRQEVDKLSRASEQLGQVQKSLKESNTRMKNNIEKFRELDENLKNLAGANIEGLEKIQEQSQAVVNRMKESLVKHEKGILMKVFDQFEFKDDKDDMSKEEFDAFLSALPQSYQQRWKTSGKTFQQYAGDDGVLQFDEFRQLTDEWVEEQAAEGGSY